ncbi:MAG: KamA family radical SAM protein [Halobacteriota archaeon]|nr:KamA family radical SAM protein [Halobacteriota archaeon]
MPWEDELKDNICTIEQLKEYIELTPREEKQILKIIERHPMSITRYYMSLIQVDDPNDPIRKMAVPSERELNLVGSYDTSGERKNIKLPGLQHKYPQTALILTTNRCATYCRHCFRKRLVGLPTEEILSRFNDAVGYIEKHEEINNVLMSGGDPFVLPTGVIGEFLEMLSAIPHLDFIRFGSRIPVTFPDRILEDEGLLTLLEHYSKKEKRIYVVTHFNHPREITQKATDAIDLLIHSGVILDNQAVLLKGINDDPDTLAELLDRLVGIGVNPYYVFQCRPVKRVKSNFQVPLGRGYQIVEDAKKKLNGHSKRFKYVMSHRTGKIEIVGVMDDYIYFKYHQSEKTRNVGKFFKRRLNETAGWLDDLEQN